VSPSNHAFVVNPILLISVATLSRSVITRRSATASHLRLYSFLNSAKKAA